MTEGVIPQITVIPNGALLRILSLALLQWSITLKAGIRAV